MIMRVSSPLHPGMPCAGFLLDVFFFHKPFLGLDRFQILKSHVDISQGVFFVFVYLFVCIFISHYSSSTFSISAMGKVQ